MCRIMIVDDSRPFLNALGAILNEAGYSDLILKESAGEAISCLKKEKSDECCATPVDLILMDVMMPDTDGIDAVAEIKKTEKLRDIPIVMVSAQDEEERIKMAFEEGAIDYVGKPLKKIELLARIRSVLRLKEEIDNRKRHQKELERLNQSLEDANKELQILSVTDSLTGIANRRYFNETLKKEWPRSVRNNATVSVIMVDVDNFKAYNDFYGHPMGDACLKAIAAALKSAINRPSDVLARYGGEEFVAMLPGTDSNGALSVATKMQNDIRRKSLPHLKSETGHVSVSIGIASIIASPKIKPEQIVSAADDALYLSKKNGRNRITVSTNT